MSDSLVKKDVSTFEGRVYTETYTLYGLIYTPPETGMDEYLNHYDRSFLPITSPMIYAKGFRHPPELKNLRAAPPFMAIPRDSILWVLGGRLSQSYARHAEAQRVAVLYENYFLSGDVKVRENMRTSSYLDNVVVQKPFQTLYNVRLCPFKRGYEVFNDDNPLETFEAVTINFRRTAGVVEFSMDNRKNKQKAVGEYGGLARGTSIQIRIIGAGEGGKDLFEDGKIEREIRQGIYLVRCEDRYDEKNDLLIVQSQLITKVYD